MSNSQMKEIRTIREREIKIKLSDADCERVSNLCGRNDLTVSKLIENFIGDLVDGTYSNGSDERMYARMWFDRCGFGMLSNETLLGYMINTWDVEDFLTLCDEIEDFKEHPEKYREEMEEAKECGEELPWFQREYDEYVEGYIKRHPDADMKKEIEKIREWYEERDGLIND